MKKNNVLMKTFVKDKPFVDVINPGVYFSRDCKNGYEFRK